MSDWFVPIFDWLANRDPMLVYIFLLFNAFFESILPPYPSDAFVLVFAFLSGQCHYDPYSVYLLTVAGSIAGMALLYSIGRTKGDKLTNILSSTFLGRIFPVVLIDRAKAKLIQRGDIVSVLNRFLPGMRAPLCFASGIVRLPLRRFLLLSAVSVVLWNLFIVTVGFYVGSTWNEASRFLKNYSLIAYLVIIVFFAVLTILYFWKRRAKQ